DDGSTSQVAGNGFNSYCEDGVHCFNIHECSDDFVKLDAETCKNLMCKYYQSSRVISNPSKSKAGRRIYLLYQPGVAEGNRGAGTCGMNYITDATGLSIKTWWSTN
ncbi:MAG: hypothetical protein SVU32_01260, partial [Candidatus Nanohaloarchaea archaeon]|nr:hypothetical protein [Candidatus Nanohaloarchaea archaeon]